MLTESRYLSEGCRCVGVGGARSITPRFRFKRIDGVFSRHKIDIATAEGIADFLIFRFGIKADNAFACLTDIGEEQL